MIDETHKLKRQYRDLYFKKPKKNNDGNYVFKQSKRIVIMGILIGVGSLYTCISFVLELLANKYLVSSKDYLSLSLMFTVLSIFIIVGFKVIISGLFHSIILELNKITLINSFSGKKKVINIDEKIELKNTICGHVIFKNGKDIIKFHLYYGGMYELIEYLEKNFLPEKNEKVIKNLKKRIRKWVFWSQIYQII